MAGPKFSKDAEWLCSIANRRVPSGGGKVYGFCNGLGHGDTALFKHKGSWSDPTVYHGLA